MLVMRSSCGSSKGSIGLVDSLRRDRARALDLDDPLAHFRSRFSMPDEDLAYLDGNSLGRPPLAGLEAVRRAAEEEWATELIRGWDHWLDAPMRVGDVLAPIIGARPGEVLVTDSTTVN